MQLYRVSALVISLIVHLTVLCVSSEPTFMYMRLESTGVNYRYVRFYHDTFQRLYNCMREVNTTQCNVKYVLRGSLPQNYLPPGSPPDPAGIDFYVQEVIIVNGFHSHREYFTCQIYQSSQTLECSRNTTSQCSEPMCISFRRRSAICDTDCVYLLWKYPEEKLVFDNKTDKYGDCKLVCAQTSNSLLPSTHRSDASTLRPEPPSDATANSSRAPAITETITSEDSSGNVGLIIGVVCGVLCLVILVIVIGVIYKRQKQANRHTSNNGVDSSRIATNYDEIAVEHSKTKISNISNIPDVLSTLPQSDLAIEKNGESEDGYYTIDNACELNKYENALKTVLSKTSTIIDDLNAQEFHIFQNEPGFSLPIFHDQEGGVVNSQLFQTREGDYFILEPENDDVKDSDTDNEHNSMGCGYSLAKDVSKIDVSQSDVSTADVNTIDVSTIDVIDVSSPPKNVYSKFGNNATDKINPYDMLLQPNGVQHSRKTCIGVD